MVGDLSIVCWGKVKSDGSGVRRGPHTAWLGMLKSKLKKPGNARQAVLCQGSYENEAEILPTPAMCRWAL